MDYNISGIWRFFEDFSDQDCQRAMEECFRYNCFSYSFIREFLSSSANMMVDPKASFSLKEFSHLTVEVRRDLREYRI